MYDKEIILVQQAKLQQAYLQKLSLQNLQALQLAFGKLLLKNGLYKDSLQHLKKLPPGLQVNLLIDQCCVFGDIPHEPQLNQNCLRSLLLNFLLAARINHPVGLNISNAIAYFQQQQIKKQSLITLDHLHFLRDMFILYHEGGLILDTPIAKALSQFNLNQAVKAAEQHFAKEIAMTQFQLDKVRMKIVEVWQRGLSKVSLDYVLQSAGESSIITLSRLGWRVDYKQRRLVRQTRDLNAKLIERVFVQRLLSK